MTVTERELFRQVADHAADFVESLGARPIRAVIAALVEDVEPGLVGIPSGRYFGFVIGGGLPAAVAGDMLASVWDQLGRHGVAELVERCCAHADVERSLEAIVTAAATVGVAHRVEA